MAFTGQRTWYISTNKYSAVAQWATGTAYTVGQIVRQLAAPADGSERTFVCIVAGTSHATTEPTWVLTRGAKTTDNTVTWMECTGVAGMNSDTDNTPTWTTGAKSTTPSLGHVIKSGDGTKLLICTTSGAAGTGAEPTWNAAGSTTTDASAVWTTLKDSSNRYAAFAAPAHHLLNAQGTNWGDAAAGSTQPVFFIGASHNYSNPASSGGNSIFGKGTNTLPVDVICISESFSGTSPATSDMTTGGKEQGGTGTATMNANGFARWYGVTFVLNGSSGNLESRFGNGASAMYFENCRFEIAGGLSTNGWFYSFSGISSYVFKDCVWKFSHAAQGIIPGNNMEFIGCSVDSGGTSPTNIFYPNNGGATIMDCNVVCRGCDWSFCTTPVRCPDGVLSVISFHDCKLPSSGTMIDTSGIAATKGRTQQVIMTRCGSDGKTCRLWYSDVQVSVVPELTAVRTNGASVNGDKVAHKITTNASAVSWAEPARVPLFSNYNGTTAGNVTATVYGIINAAAVPSNLDLYAAVDYLGNSGNVQSKRATNRPAFFPDAGSSLTADSTSAWDSVATARQNSHAYSVGDMISLASNSGRLFFCTTAGTSAGSEPGGYATAVDGGSVTDGGAVFRAGCRFKIAFQLDTTHNPQPQIAGNMQASIIIHKASTTWFIDPFLELT